MGGVNRGGGRQPVEEGYPESLEADEGGLHSETGSGSNGGEELKAPEPHRLRGEAGRDGGGQLDSGLWR